MKTILTSILLYFTMIGLYGQGKPLEDSNPVVNLWEWEGPEEREGMEEIEGAEKTEAPLVGDMGQRFFFIVGGKSEQNMMAPFEMEGMGFACPTYFTVTGDKKYLYIKMLECCILDLPEEEKSVKVQYSVNEKGDRLTLTMNGKEYNYIPWKP